MIFPGINKRFRIGWLAFLIFSLGAAFQAEASDEKGGTESPFSLGAGGRIIALGGAGSAVWDEACPVLWNPAGLSMLEKGSVGLFHTPLLDESTSYSSLIAAWPTLDFGVLSFSVLQLKTSGIERRDENNMIYGSDLSNSQTRYLIGYGRELFSGVSAGLNLKLDRFSQGEFSASGFGLDLGIGFRGTIDSPVIDGAAFGLSMRNIIEPSFLLVSEESGDPSGVRAGMALWRSIFKGRDDRLLLAVDLDKSRYSETTLHAGIEYKLGIAALRGGYDAGFPVFGAGFETYNIRLDYAFRSTDIEGCHLFSISYDFGVATSQRRIARRRERELEIAAELEKKTSKYESDQIMEYMSKAETARENGKYDAAISWFNTVLLWDPVNDKAIEGVRETTALRHVHSGDSLFAGEYYAEALLQYRSGNEFFDSESLAERIKVCEGLINQAEDSREMVERVLSRALELYTSQEWDEAARAFREVIDIDPSNEIAAKYYVKAIEKKEDEYRATLQAIDRAIASGRLASAEDMVRSGLQARPGDEGFTSRMTRIGGLVAARREEESRAEAIEPMAAKPGPEEARRLMPVYERGVRHFRNGEFSEAIDQWEVIWKKWPGFENLEDYLIKAYQYRGMELYTAHEYENALEVWGRILDIDPDNDKAIRYIRRTREELSRLERVTG